MVTAVRPAAMGNSGLFKPSWRAMINTSERQQAMNIVAGAPGRMADCLFGTRRREIAESNIQMANIHPAPICPQNDASGAMRAGLINGIRPSANRLMFSRRFKIGISKKKKGGKAPPFSWTAGISYLQLDGRYLASSVPAWQTQVTWPPEAVGVSFSVLPEMADSFAEAVTTISVPS